MGILGEFKKSLLFSKLITLSVLVFSLMHTGCITNFGENKKNSQTSSKLTSSTSGTPGFLLVSVVKNNFNPTQIMDLISDGTGSFGKNCGSGQPCVCRFNYTVSGGGTQSFDQAIQYAESDLIRCSYTPIPGTAQNVTVKIQNLASNVYTNTMNFPLYGGGGNFDPTNPLNFAEATRYQCRHYPQIGHALYPSVYDPILSEDPIYTYPLDYYTTNPYRAVSESMYIYAQSQTSAGWDCPTSFNDQNFGLNLKLFSAGSYSYNFQSTKELFPTPPGFPDRQKFILSKIQAGIFSEPLYALAVPGEPRIPRPYIGFAAKSTVISPGIEKCPDPTTPIPPGFKWAKLWLFRADLSPRRLPFSQKLSQVGVIACDPGVVNATTPAVARGCHDANPATAFANPARCGLADFNGTTCSAGRPLVDRVFGNGQCFGLAANRTPAASNNFTPGTEEWQKKINAGLLFTCAEVAAGRATDPMNVCRLAQNPIAPLDTQVMVGTNIDQAQTRYDFLFVVSDTSVNTLDMQNVTSSIALAHTPVRFFMNSDCLGNDPDSPNCNQSRRINYGLKLHDINGNGDPPASDPRRGGTFPLCVLQPN